MSLTPFSLSDKSEPVYNQAKAFRAAVISNPTAGVPAIDMHVCEANCQTLLHDQWPDAPHERVLEYKVLLKVGNLKRGRIASMLNRISLPMRPNQEGSISQLAVRLVRRIAGLKPITTDQHLFIGTVPVG